MAESTDNETMSGERSATTVTAPTAGLGFVRRMSRGEEWRVLVGAVARDKAVYVTASELSDGGESSGTGSVATGAEGAEKPSNGTQRAQYHCPELGTAVRSEDIA